MAKRNDIHKILIIGSGPIVIGQACEFDYSGTQACKALKSLGYQIVLVNSNPATIMTDPGMADATYIEPLNVERLTQIIEKERPDALLPNLGGQTGLNLSSELNKAGVLAKYNVQIIGVQADAIERGEDRLAFKETMKKLGIDLPQSDLAYTVEEAEAVAAKLGYPVVIRPAYTMGGTGGGMVFNVEELRVVAARGITASLIGQLLVEESVLGWEELELEVVRDSKNQMITVCFIENIDAMGVHTGDSFCAAPMLTIDPKLQKKLQKWSYDIVEAIGVIGGTNIQFAHDPKTGRVVIIEINPRTSRSSALASKATGFPIARVSTLLAAGHTMDEITYWRDGTLEKYTPSGDYVVIKFARWAFEKFKGSIDKLGTQMRAVGEAMSIGKNYKEAFQKAIRSLETGRHGLGFAKDFNKKSLPELMGMLCQATSERQFIMYEALRKGADVEELYRLTYIKPYFIQQMKELVELEEQILKHKGKALPDKLLIQAKKDGFADKYLAKILGVPEKAIRDQRRKLGIMAGWHAVPVSGVENAAYYYSTYNAPDASPVSNKRKVMILGGGPNRIGQGIEFDYCCCHAAFMLKEQGIETIMVNCNPETVSTDYDTSDKLYFEPLTVEDVLAIYEKEKPEGVICQFGGQTPLNIAAELQEAGVKILGTTVETIAAAEDRDLFRKMMEKIGIPMPESGMATTIDEAVAVANKIGYPLMVRPSFVLGGRGMEVVQDELMLREYMAAAVDVTPDRPILIDRFLQEALECEADALADGTDVFVPAVMEHIELAGIHSGDSACVIPPVTIPKKHLDTINEYTRRIARELKVVGLMNIQYAIENDKVYVLEANPRASRTVPIVSKVCGFSMARSATQLMLGAKLSDLKLKPRTPKHFGVKESVFPFGMYPEVDPVLGPEMRSTGEVLGLADSFGMAFFKAEEAAKPALPTSGAVLITTVEKNKQLVEIGRGFQKLGFKILATEGTQKFLEEHGVASTHIKKQHEGRPNITDAITNKEIQLVINTPAGKRSRTDDSYIRKSAIKHKVPYMTTLAAALASVRGIEAERAGRAGVKSLQAYHAGIEQLMPKRTDIKKVLIIGAGPIVIGQACEFDYSGTQACKALREEGYKVVLVNSNPATIMTDPEFADATYIEPVTPEAVEKIIEKEKPDALLPTLGGQTGLNTAMALWRNGVLQKHGVEMIGAKADAIEKGENRLKFKEAMIKIGLDVPKSGVAHTLDECRDVARQIGTFPLIIRPAYTLGGTGGGIAYNREEFDAMAQKGLEASPVSEILIEESLIGWKEFETEVMRDKNDNCVIVCSIENLDPMGVHTGDSITVAPVQTLTDKEWQNMRDASFACIREIGVETGGSNIQFAVNPANGRMTIIEMNPRVSRSSALASKATGFPIAKFAAKLAVGYTLDEIPNDITKETPASFEPTIDYVVTKIPRFAFEKFPMADPTLTTQMKSVGEVMAIGRTFKESLQKALRGLEIGAYGLGGGKWGGGREIRPREEIERKLITPCAERIFYIRHAIRAGFGLDEIHRLSKIDPWFLQQIKEIVEMEDELVNAGSLQALV